MTVSKEVKMAVDEIHRERDALASARKANELQETQIADLKSQIAAASSLSDDDRKALLDAINDVQDTNSQLATAVPANVDNGGAAAAGNPAPEPVPLPDDPMAPRPDPIAGTGQNGPVPLMPNSAFDPAGGVKPPVADSGQPNQPAAIETAGGFVIAGGGSTQRAPGSKPESPSSTLVVQDDPNAKAPASTADEVKSGLGDSGQNASKGPDGRPASEGPGVVDPSGAPVAKPQGQPDPTATDSGSDAARANRGVDPGTVNDLRQSPQSNPNASPVS